MVWSRKAGTSTLGTVPSGVPAQCDFFGVDGSTIIHVNLRRNMSDIVLRRDFSSFQDDIRASFVRLLSQIKKFSGNTQTTDNDKQLFVVFDGKRIDGKQANRTRTSARDEAMNRVDAALAKDAAADIAKKALSACGGWVI